MLPEAEQVELVASLLEAIGTETKSEDALSGCLLALGLLVYCAEREGEVLDVCKALDAGAIVRGKGGMFENGKGKESGRVVALIKEVGDELLGKGL